MEPTVYKKVDVTDKIIIGSTTIESLMKLPFDKHIASFEIPMDLRGIIDDGMMNVIITWYLKWKISEHPERQNTCTLREIFGTSEYVLVIIAINLYKYLRGMGYDPDVIGKFINKQQ